MLPGVLICPDSFKGSLSAGRVAEIISEEVNRIAPTIETYTIPLADGGEGTFEILSELYPERVEVEVNDPLGRKIKVIYGIDRVAQSAFIESARAIGLPLIAPADRNPLIASSYGLGEVITDAVKRGCKKITVALGGSATADGGRGMLEALKGDLSNIKFMILCDVKNPLLGPMGATYVFARQKGAKEEDLPLLEARMEEFLRFSVDAGICEEKDQFRPGAGAAGGLGFAFMTYLGAECLSGISFLMKALDFDRILDKSRLVITGEGKTDRQSLMGKVVGEVVAKASQKGIPVIAIAGMVEDEPQLLKAGLTGVFSIARNDLSEEKNMLPSIAEENLRSKIREIAPLILQISDRRL